jgi:hypothetical protein
MDTAAALRSAEPHPANLARVRQGELGRCAPEVLRLAAFASLDPDHASHGHCLAELRRAYDLSLDQGARFWSLRGAISLFEVAREGHPDHGAAGLVQSRLISIGDGSTQPDPHRARRLAPGQPLAPEDEDPA